MTRERAKRRRSSRRRPRTEEVKEEVVDIPWEEGKEEGPRNSERIY